MSMTPESPLFGQYEAQLDEQIAELAFAQRVNAALDTIDGYHDLSRDERLMLDARRIGSLVAMSGMVDGKQIGKSIYQNADYGNQDERPTTVHLSPPFDEITRADVPCVTRVAKLTSPGYSSYNVYRVMVMPTAQKVLSDGRGCYIARSTQDSTVTMFKVVTDTASARRATTTLVPKIELITGNDRQSVLDELEKAAATISALPPAPKSRW